MPELHLPVPGPAWGPYPERERERTPGWEHVTRLAPSLQSRRRRQQFLRQIRHIRADPNHAAQISTLVRQEELLRQLQRQGFAPRLAAEALLRIGRACHRELGLDPTESQYLAAWVILNGGLAELPAGEGKTLVVAMAACAAAVTGVPVHAVTANDYLVERDAAAMGPLYEHFGLTVACVTKLSTLEQRRRAYRADITYCTAREVGFDYLRDIAAPATDDASAGAPRGRAAAATGDRALRGLCMAIVDEADAILIDDACSPMSISRPAPSGASLTALEQAMQSARRLEPDRHYRLDTSIQNVQLTAEGKARLAESLTNSSAHWRNPRQREELVDLALYAIHLLARDRDYVLQGNGVALIDPTTGQADSGRDWNRGLIQMLALKEGVTPPPINETVAQMSLQSLFSRYHWLGGVSANLRRARLELALLYGLRVTRIAAHVPRRWREGPARVFAQRFIVWRAVAQRVRELQAGGRPVLIGTDSLPDAEALAAVLSKQGLRSQILSGRQDSIENSAIARAGRPLRVTIAAQMAGRGTEIELAPGVAETGGLHVISCLFSAVRRGHDQLLDHAARRGQAGSGEMMLCLDQGVLAQRLPGALRDLVRRLYSGRIELPRALGSFLCALAQGIEKFVQRWTLWRLRREDRSWRRRMAMSARPRESAPRPTEINVSAIRRNEQ
jgi:preprotein translocase subunit SecA